MRDQKREKNNNWKGGMSFNKITGYYTSSAPWHPFSWENGRILTHRLIMEEYLSELAGEDVIIPSEYDVHHKNEIKTDNRIENLEILEHGMHTMGHNFVDRTGWHCYSCGTTKSLKIGKKGILEPYWRKHPTIEGEHLCNICIQRAINKELIICIDCKEQKKKHCKGLCEKCYNRRISNTSPIIQCNMSGCDNTFHELDTNGKKRELCRACRLRAKRNARMDSKTKD